MKNFTLRLLKNNLPHLLLFAILSLPSCQRELEHPHDEPSTIMDHHAIIEGAKEFSRKNSNGKIKISVPVKSATSDDEISFNADWTKLTTIECRPIFNIEVPLHNNKSTSSICELTTYINGEISKQEESMIQSSLFVEYNETTKKYSQYTVSRVWLKENAPQEGMKIFNNFDVESYLFLSNSDGEIVSALKSINGKLYTLRFINELFPTPKSYNELTIWEQKLKFHCELEENETTKSSIDDMEIHIGMWKMFENMHSRLINDIPMQVWGYCQKRGWAPLFGNIVITYRDRIYKDFFYDADYNSLGYNWMMQYIYDLYKQYGMSGGSGVFAEEVITKYDHLRWNALEKYITENRLKILDAIIERLLKNYYLEGDNSGGASGGGSGGGSIGGDGGGVGGNTCYHQRCPVCRNFIITDIPTGECTKHIRCKSDGNCMLIQLTLSTNRVKLGHDYTISIRTIPENAKCNSISYEINEFGCLKTHTLPVDAPLLKNLTVTAKTGGKYRIRAVILDSKKSYTYTSNIETIEHEVLSAGEIIKLPKIKAAMEASWTATIASTDKDGMQEHGGVVFVDTRLLEADKSNIDDIYVYKPCSGTKVPYSNLSADIKFDCDYGRDCDPTYASYYPVLLFHTHPPLNKYEGSIVLSRPPGPSVLDTKQDTIPSVVMDFNILPPIRYTSEMKILPPTKLYPCNEKLNKRVIFQH